MIVPLLMLAKDAKGTAAGDAAKGLAKMLMLGVLNPGLDLSASGPRMFPTHVSFEVSLALPNDAPLPFIPPAAPPSQSPALPGQRRAA